MSVEFSDSLSRFDLLYCLLLRNTIQEVFYDVKRSICTILCLIIALTLFTSAFAAMREPDASPAYKSISSLKVSLSISNGTGSAAGSVQVQSNYHAKITTQLQRQDGSAWTPICTWSNSSNTRSTSAGGDKTLTKGCTYRTYITVNVYDSNLFNDKNCKRGSSLLFCIIN